MEKFYAVSDTFFRGLLIFIPLAILAQAAHLSGVLVFILSAIAVIPLAKYIGEATEELATRTTPAIGGLLNAAFGNAPELLIGIFALRAGLFDLVKASITGSIIGNLLLVLGVSMFVGGWGREKQSFNRTAVLASGSTLFLVAIALIVPALFVQTQTAVDGAIIEHLSIVVSCALLLVYVASLFFSLRTHKHLYLEEVEKFEPRWSLYRSVMTLALSTVAVAWISEILVASVNPLIAGWGWSQLFIGVIVVGVIANAAEHYSAVLVAHKNRMDLSLQIAIGSATQIAMVVAPILVLISLTMQPMNLVFDTFELIAIVLSVLIVNLVVADGESNWLEGVQLLAAYAIIAVAFFFHP
jgi:Ca2+:H+ antiporter